MSKRKPINIDRRDYDRVLITETLPYETPIIFSGDGVYSRLKNLEKTSQIHQQIVDVLIRGNGGKKDSRGSVPLHYKVRKNSAEFRRLSLIHPRAQWRIRKFYERYESLLLYYCSLSPASIRAPERVAGSFFKKSSWENIYKFKAGGVATLSMEELSKHTPSFFAYRGFDRLYKFFESPDFFSLEKEFVSLRTLDVSKCFDSIYTPCLGWAVKDKEFTKKNLQAHTFADEFDWVMRFANHNETNGIVIGPEVSRVFAEIIFQEIDRRCFLRLGAKLKFGVEYTVRRYVDDVFIFARSEAVAADVYECYADVLTTFNLHANAVKSRQFARPFATDKSKLITAASDQVNSFLDKFLEANGGVAALTPKYVRSPWRLTRSFVDGLKATCTLNKATYDDVASYLISVFSERVKKLVTVKLAKTDTASHRDYCTALEVLLETIFFLYAVAPSVAASYKVCTAVLLATRFSEKQLRDFHPKLSQRIYQLTVAHLAQERQSAAAGVEGFVPLETMNLLLVARELGPEYLLPETMVSELFKTQGTMSYFQIMCCLYYVKDAAQFASLRAMAIAAVKTRLSDLSDLLENTEKAYLFLDMLSCPYATEIDKRKWIRDAYSTFQLAKPAKAEVTLFLAQMTEDWHIAWAGVDLLNLLERKELRQVY
jgi:hypothetical protein